MGRVHGERVVNHGASHVPSFGHLFGGALMVDPFIHLNAFYLVVNQYGLIELWNGYVEDESDFHYSRFAGFQFDGVECWILERKDKHTDFTPITILQAHALIQQSKRYAFAAAH